MGFKAAPLPHEYMLVGIIGFFVSVFQIIQWSKTWGFTLALFCLLLIVASIVSVSTKELDEETLDIISGEPYANNKRKTLKHIIGEKR